MTDYTRRFIGGYLNGQTRISNLDSAFIDDYRYLGDVYYRMDFYGQIVFRHESVSENEAKKLLATDAVHISLSRLSEFNMRRSDILWPGCRDWSSNDWLMATLGELGEAANIVKKMKRDGETPELIKALHKELCDVINYCNLHITMTGGDTEEVLRDKWNEVSRWNDCPIRL